ncbi:hypothetical protein HDV05_002274 [Chytridiales sp. JEL 0842]|nr:hypothetical protein HDV05_002274 [Chytridiales sp. JEL 0842]
MRLLLLLSVLAALVFALVLAGTTEPISDSSVAAAQVDRPGTRTPAVTPPGQLPRTTRPAPPSATTEPEENEEEEEGPEEEQMLEEGPEELVPEDQEGVENLEGPGGGVIGVVEAIGGGCVGGGFGIVVLGAGGEG